MTILRRLILGAAVTAGCAGDSGVDRREACGKVRDRAAELSATRSGENLAVDERAKHERALADSAGDEFVRRCVAGWSEKAIDCALAASTAEEMKRCR